MKQISVQELDKSELVELVKQAVSEAFNQTKEKDFIKKTFNVKETAKVLNRSENYIRKIIHLGVLKTTADGKFITGKEINKYLGNYEE